LGEKQRVAFVGAGYAADYYIGTMPNHPQLSFAGVYDRDAERQRAFAGFHGVRGYRSLDDLLSDPDVDVVVNLTNPASHATVTEAALHAGKHVYGEKPLTLDLGQATELARLADERGLLLRSAPCSLLGRPAQTAWRALRDGRVGTPRLVYAELDAGAFQHGSPDKWVSRSGVPWPYVDEFSTGVVLEHAAYKLSWLTAFFGPVVRVTAMSAPVLPMDVMPMALMPPGVPVAPDFGTACLIFASGVVCRLTLSLAAPHDETLRIIGDAGTLAVAHSGDFASPVTITYGSDPDPAELDLLDDGVVMRCDETLRVFDFARGVADLAEVAARGGRGHLPIDHALHVLEVTLLIAGATNGITAEPTTTCAPVEPPPWAS
jgi:predicted dehydrogenase